MAHYGKYVFIGFLVFLFEIILVLVLGVGLPNNDSRGDDVAVYQGRYINN